MIALTPPTSQEISEENGGDMDLNGLRNSLNPEILKKSISWELFWIYQLPIPAIIE